MRRPIDALIQDSHSQRNQILREVRGVELPVELETFVSRYEQLPFSRDRYLWHWAWYLCCARDPGFMLSCVPAACSRDVALVKTMVIMVTTIVDDVADKLQDQTLLEQFFHLNFSNASDQFFATRSEPVRLVADLLASANVGITRQVFNSDEFAQGPNQQTQEWVARARSAGIEQKLFDSWDMHRDQALWIGEQIQSVDVNQYIDGLEKVTTYHLSSTGAI